MSKKSIDRVKVDILLPYWGDFTLLKTAVDSILVQTEKHWRLLIVDDCYPSNEASRYFTNFPDKRVSYYRHEKNLGLVKNFNYVLDQVTADYCMLMGCDDVMLPTYLETALSHIGSADYYQPGVEIIDEIGRKCFPLADRIKHLLRPKKPGIYSGETVVASLCHGNWLYFPSILWKTASVQKYGFDETKHNTQDVITELQILMNGGSLFVDDSVTFQYRRSALSFSSKAKGGTRFHEENETYSRLSRQYSAMRWKKASLAAKVHITVRIHQLLSR